MLVAVALGTSPGGAGEHLLAGATAFREGRFATALVEFRVAERLGDPDARSYAGAALVKLGRVEEAVEAFGVAPAADEDALLSYYRALALKGAGLLLSADAALGSVGDRSGPRIAAEVARLRADIAAALGGGPTRADVDAAMGRASAFRAEGRLPLAAAWYHEAAALARRAGRHRLDEALQAVSELGKLAARRQP
jgi:tetratricopeptide (TPR) repeat protein